MSIVASIVTLILTPVILKTVFPLIEVTGCSMYPTYKDGELCFCTRLFRKSRLKVGDVITYRMNDRLVIKRVENICKDRVTGELLFYCVGDNAENSYDSRSYGFFSNRKIVGKLLDQRRCLNR